MKSFKALLLVVLVLLANNTFAQYAAPGTSPFTAVRANGDQTLVQVDGKWYEILAIDNVPASHILEYCHYTYKDHWLLQFSEHLPEVMKQLKNPLHEVTPLQLLADNQRLTIKSISTKKHWQAVKTYNDTQNKLNRTKTSAPVSAIKNYNLSKDKPYAFQSAKVEYLYTGAKADEGKEIRFISDYGRRIVVINERKDAKGNKHVKTTIWDNNRTTTIDHSKKTWSVSAQRAENTIPIPVGYANEDELKQAGYTRLPDEQLSGKTCYVVKNSSSGITYLLWKGLDLKQIHSNYSKIAVAVYEGAATPASVTKIPADYKKQ